jgi:Do/DeqQ family serine protease
MKTIARHILISSAVCIIALLIYSNYFEKAPIIVQQQGGANPSSLVDLMLDKNFEKHFHAAAPDNFITAANKTRPAVVYIRTLEEEHSWLGEQERSAGSGVIISADGYIVTNNHVIDDGQELQVTLDDNRTFTAELIGVDPNTDLALIKIEAVNLPYIIFGNSDSLSVGEWVLAVGNPFRLQSTVTAGIVSAKGRDIDILDLDYGIESFIQTDAAINPGNSGGALVNTRGELVGISTAILTYSGSYEGYSFAVPANLARKVINDLKEFGAVHRGLLGIEGSTVTEAQVEQLNLKEVAGILVTLVFAKGGASKAGIQKGDVIVEANGAKTRTMSDLLEQIGRFRPGDKVNLKYSRNGEIYSADILLRNQLNTTDLVNIRKDKLLTGLGMEIRDLIASEKRQTELEGVKVISIYKGSVVANTKMEPGYIITRINEIMVINADAFISELSKINGRVFLEGYYEKHGGPWWYAFEK